MTTTTKLPVLLDNVRIATPCSADWDDMAGDERVRFCGKCEKNVYNLSAMTRDEAEALLRAKEGRLCVRIYQRRDGTVLTSDCPVGVRRARLRHRVWATMSGFAASVALAVGVAIPGGRARADLAVDGHKVKHPPCPTQPTQPVRLMGSVAPPPPVMGKLVMPKPPVEPERPQPKMGEPAPLMGDVAVVEPAKKK